MKQIKFEDIQLIPIVDSAKRKKISDEVYFSKEYSGYISNSRLKYINPEENGSPALYLNPPHIKTQALCLGSAIHECTLQPESFTLGPKLKKPTAKLGVVIDKVKEYRNQNYGIYDAIIQASKDCNYYVNQINTKLSKIIKDGFEYYWKSKRYNDSYILLSDGDWEICSACIDNLKKNTDIQKVLHPTDMFDNFLPSFNEDALFLDVIVTYNGHCVTLKLKMKADNWTIDEENKTLVLNDVKTTSKPCAWFMNSEYGSFYHYHYYRQFALYMMMLQTYCMKEYGFNHNWTSKGHVLVVNTSEYDTRLCYVSKEQFAKGKEEYEQLLKRIGYYTINGFEEEVEFV